MQPSLILRNTIPTPLWQPGPLFWCTACFVSFGLWALWIYAFFWLSNAVGWK